MPCVDGVDRIEERVDRSVALVRSSSILRMPRKEQGRLDSLPSVSGIGQATPLPLVALNGGQRRHFRRRESLVIDANLIDSSMPPATAHFNGVPDSNAESIQRDRPRVRCHPIEVPVDIQADTFSVKGAADMVPLVRRNRRTAIGCIPERSTGLAL